MVPFKWKPYDQNWALRLRHTPAPNSYKKRDIKYVNRLDHDLPMELWDMIIDCLQRSTGDLIRVSAVCKPWRILADSIRQKQTGPFLLLRPAIKHGHMVLYHLFDFSKNMTQQIQLPVSTTDQLILRNSLNEWILTCNKTNDKYDHVRFLNLLSRAQVGLPPISIYKISINKVTVSSAPSDPNCVFMAICGKDKMLAFCKQRDLEWKILRSESHEIYEDIVYFKGEFYAVGMGGNLVVCDIDGPEPKVLNVAPTVPTTRSDSLYLVESSSNLYLIIRTDRVKNDDARKKSEIYKLNLSGQKWQKVNSLGDDSAIFVGHHMSMSISAKDFPVKRDCIYFTTFPLRYTFREGCQVFNLKTKLFEPTFLVFS